MNAFTQMMMQRHEAVVEALQKMRGPRRPIITKRMNAATKKRRHEGNLIIRAHTNAARSRDPRNCPVWHGCINGSPILTTYRGGSPFYLKGTAVA